MRHPRWARKDRAAAGGQEFFLVLEVIHNGVGTQGFPRKVEPRAVFFRELVNFFLDHGNELRGGALGRVFIHEVGKNRGQVGILHGDGDAITGGQKLIGARAPVIDPPGSRGHLNDDGIPAQRTGALQF